MSISISDREISGQAPHPLTHTQRQLRVIGLLGLGLIYGISLVVSRGSLPSFTVCWFRIATGWACPTCGLTRAFTEIGHGNLEEATRLNLMAIPLFLFGLAIAGALVHELIVNRSWLYQWMSQHRVAGLVVLSLGVLMRYLVPAF